MQYKLGNHVNTVIIFWLSVMSLHSWKGGETVRERAMHSELGDLGMSLGFAVTSCVTLGMTFSLSDPELPQL